MPENGNPRIPFGPNWDVFPRLFCDAEFASKSGNGNLPIGDLLDAIHENTLPGSPSGKTKFNLSRLPGVVLLGVMPERAIRHFEQFRRSRPNTVARFQCRH